jgi:hypothetical protein
MRASSWNTHSGPDSGHRPERGATACFEVGVHIERDSGLQSRRGSGYELEAAFSWTLKTLVGMLPEA